METIHSNGELIAIFVSRRYSPEHTEFFSPEIEPLQFGIGVYPKGGSVEPHRHIGDPTQVNEFQEFIYLRRGRVRTQIFTTRGECLKELIMETGDFLMLFRGGHSFHFLEETELLEVKQGPYQGRAAMKSFVALETVS